jgi:RNA-directed DNA polymerase
MEREFPNNPWCRYADDAIIHCVSEKQAQYLREVLEKRFHECKLEIYSDKTKIVYYKDSNRAEEKNTSNLPFLDIPLSPGKPKEKEEKYSQAFFRH